MPQSLEISIVSNTLPLLTFDDPNYVRAHAIIISAADRSVHAVLHESDVMVGQIDEKTLRELYAHEHVALTARRPDGSYVTIHSPLKISRA